jgi:hypothetical protein
MKPLIGIILALLLTALAACDTISRRQFLLSPELQENEIEKLKKQIDIALADTIQKYGLVNSIHYAQANGVLLYFTTEDSFPIQLGARNTDKGIVIDLIHFHPGTGETERYTELLSDLIDDLETLEGVHFVELNQASRIQ